MPSDPKQLTLSEFQGADNTATPQPVECLGMTFESDEAQQAHFLASVMIYSPLP